jgi:cytochrome c
MKSWAGVAAIVVGFVATQAFAQEGNAARGERVFNQQCKTCHSLEEGPSLTGPTLHGMFGRKAGTAAGFEFSPEMIKSGIVWDETTLAEYSRDPKAKVPDTKMVFNGIKQPGQLADLVAYLKQATK